MSQNGLDLICMLPDEYGNHALMQSCSSCWFIAPTLPMSTFELAPASRNTVSPNSHGFIPIAWTYSGVPTPRVSNDTFTFLVRPYSAIPFIAAPAPSGGDFV